MAKSNINIGAGKPVTLFAQDITPPDTPDDLKIITMVSDAEQEFLEDPWEGAKIYTLFEGGAREYEVLSIHPKTLQDLQNIAATYREVLKAHQSSVAGCIINFSVIPALPGNLGVIFGYNVLISVIQNGAKFEVRYNTYEEDDSGALFSTTESAWKIKVEQKLGESFENFFNRLFFINV